LFERPHDRWVEHLPGFHAKRTSRNGEGDDHGVGASAVTPFGVSLFRHASNYPCKQEIEFAVDSHLEGDGLKFFLFINRIDWQTILKTPLDIKGFFGTLANLA
jgi:hypothetical protein